MFIAFDTPTGTAPLFTANGNGGKHVEDFDNVVGAALGLPRNAMSDNGLPEIVNDDEFITERDDYRSIWGARLPTPGTSLCGGSPKAGKTRFCMALGHCVVSGLAFLNEPVVEPGPVLFYSLEGPRSVLRKHLRMLREKLGRPTHRLIVRMPRRRSPELLLTQLQKDITTYKPVLVIIDTLFKLIGLQEGQINDYFLIERLAQLESLARDHDTHIMCTHHASKVYRRGKDVDPFDAFLGSQAIRGSSDSNFLVVRNKKKGTLTLQSEERANEHELPETLIKWRSDGMLILASTATKDEAADLITLVFNYMNDPRMEPKSKDEIATGLHKRAADVRDAVDTLVADGRFVQTQEKPALFCAGALVRPVPTSTVYIGNDGTGTSAPQLPKLESKSSDPSPVPTGRERDSRTDGRNGTQAKSRKSEQQALAAEMLALMRSETEETG